MFKGRLGRGLNSSYGRQLSRNKKYFQSWFYHLIAIAGVICVLCCLFVLFTVVIIIIKIVIIIIEVSHVDVVSC